VKIFVTGATGFVGRAFCELARARGHQIATLERPYRLDAPPWEQIAKFEPETCLHAAWIATPGVYLTSPLNADYLKWSLDFAKRMRKLGTRHFVSLGTCIEYAPSDQPMDEASSPVAPRSPYAVAKNELRIALENDACSHGMTVAWARLFYPYGPGEHPQRLSSIIARRLRQNETVMLNTPGSVKDYIHIADVASALLAITEAGTDGVVNIGTGHGVAVREIADTLAQLLGKPDLVREASPPQPDEYPYLVADAGKLASLGWQPHYDLASGLQTLIDSLP